MKLPVALCTAALCAAAIEGARAQSASSPAAGVEWVVAPVASVAPQTEAEKERGVTFGRALPALEVLQPTLDPDLPDYHPSRVNLRGHFKAATSDVLPGLAKAWVAAFEHYYPGVRIDIGPPYAGSLGAEELAKGTLDFVFVSRELRPDDVRNFRARFGYEPLSVPICGGSYRHFGFLDTIGFIVNKSNPIERLSFDQIDAAFSSTRFRGAPAVVTWGDLGLSGDWANKPVHLVGAKPWNGFEEFIRQRVLSTPGHRGEWRDNVDFSPTVFPIADKVAADPYALGYDGLAYLSVPVKVLEVGRESSGPFFAPTYENVATADYPLARVIYFNINKNPAKALDPVPAEFLRFVLSREGQAIVQRQKLYLPLRAKQVRESRSLLGP